MSHDALQTNGTDSVGGTPILGSNQIISELRSCKLGRETLTVSYDLRCTWGTSHEFLCQYAFSVVFEERTAFDPETDFAIDA